MLRKAVLFYIIVNIIHFSHQSTVEDKSWRQIVQIGDYFIARGNLTSWRSLACCADNATVRPANESRLINYVNTTWCKGNNSCMSYIPKTDIKYAYCNETK